MDETRVFKSYNGFLELSNDSLAYDYIGAGYYEDVPARPRPYRRPAKEPARHGREWVRDDIEAADEMEARPITRQGQGVSLLTLAGFAMAAILLVLLLMSQIRLTELSDHAASEQQRVTELTERQHKLQAQYEQTFSMSAVEKYATEELGMRKATEDQIVYLEGVGAESRACVITPENETIFSVNLRELWDSLRSYFAGCL